MKWLLLWTGIVALVLWLFHQLMGRRPATINESLAERIRQNNGCPDCGGALLRGPDVDDMVSTMCAECMSKFNLLILEDAGVVWAERT